MSHVVSDDEVVSDNALEESWHQLLASWAIDNRQALFELVANVKWLEMKKMVEKMIISMEIAGRDENEMPIEESLPEIKGPERSSGASNSQHQASRYAYGALHRRRAAVLPPPPSVETAKDADVYANGKTHTDYMDAAAKEPAHKQLCSACFFERDNDRSFIQIRFHFSDLHKVVGVDCPLCSFRFVTASALSYHMGFCHKVVAKGEEINVLTPD